MNQETYEIIIKALNYRKQCLYDILNDRVDHLKKPSEDEAEELEKEIEDIDNAIDGINLLIQRVLV